MTITQENRFLQIKTSLGNPDELLLTQLTGTEGLSMPFSFDLDLFSTTNHSIAFEDIIGENVTITLRLADGQQRFFNGFISSFSQSRANIEDERERLLFSTYHATMVPWLWFLTTTANMRIFQNKSVPDIVEEIFNIHGLSDYQLDLKGTHKARTYCVQYRETDFNFISRLLESEGIYYFFTHDNGFHTMVIADHLDGHPDLPNQDEIYYFHDIHSGIDEDSIAELELTSTIQPSKFIINDYNFETPGATIQAEATTGKKLGPLEEGIYDYPGEYCDREEGDIFCHYRMKELEAQMTVLSGTSDVRDAVSGHKFTLLNFPRADMTDKPYVLTAINHHITQSGFRTRGEGGGEEDSYSNSFTCIPHETPFIPPRITPKPVVEGVQTAEVVGPSGEEIETDKYGRVKVQFHWDREGKGDENSSCWIRVSQPIAGSGWGGMFVPRIGHEVIVSFLEGDPDRPIITGRVYHNNNMPPYDLPDEKTKSTIKSNSSKKGEGFNELRFEDKKGDEQIFIHAEKNMDIRVKKDRFETIKNNRHLHVEKDKREKVDNNRSEIIGKDHMEEIGKDRHLKVSGKEAVHISGSKSLTVGSHVTEVFKKGHSEETTEDYYLKADNIVIEGMTNVTVKVGQSYIAIEASGIKLGTMGAIELEATGEVKIKGTSGVKVESPATAEVTSTMTTINGDATLTVSGGLVKIN